MILITHCKDLIVDCYQAYKNVDCDNCAHYNTCMFNIGIIIIIWTSFKRFLTRTADDNNKRNDLQIFILSVSHLSKILTTDLY